MLNLKSGKHSFKAYNLIWTENKSNKRSINNLSRSRNKSKNKNSSLLITLNQQSLLYSKMKVLSYSSNSKRCLKKIKSNSMIRLKRTRKWTMSK